MENVTSPVMDNFEDPMSTDTRNDYLCALLLQKEFDKEYDQQFDEEEKKYSKINNKSKGRILTTAALKEMRLTFP